MPTRLPRVRSILLVLYTGFLLIATIGPVPQRLEGSEAPLGVLSFDRWLEASTWREGTGFEFMLNVLLFVPWGVLALLTFSERRWWLAAVLGMALTLTIEIIQIPLPRISDPRDLFANTLGVLIGIAAGVVVRRTRMFVSPRATEPSA